MDNVHLSIVCGFEYTGNGMKLWKKKQGTEHNNSRSPSYSGGLQG
jgi:hypothetical protein